MSERLSSRKDGHKLMELSYEHVVGISEMLTRSIGALLDDKLRLEERFLVEELIELRDNLRDAINAYEGNEEYKRTGG